MQGTERKAIFKGVITLKNLQFNLLSLQMWSSSGISKQEFPQTSSIDNNIAL